MDDHDRHWHDDATTGLSIGVWVAVAAAIALAVFAGWFATKAFANAAHAVVHAEEWRM